MEKQKLIKVFYTVCDSAGMDGKSIIAQKFAAVSAKQLDNKQLEIAIAYVGEQSHLWRRRVMAAIGAYLRKNNKTSDATIIKAIACRAAKTTNFNRIKLDELQRLYNQFSTPVAKYSAADVQRMINLN